jgi:hypothetical protein
VLLAPWDDEVDPRISERSLAATEALAQAAGHLAGGQEQAAAPVAGDGEATANGGDGQVAAGTRPQPQADAAPEAAKPLRRRRSAFAAARAAARQ